MKVTVEMILPYSDELDYLTRVSDRQLVYRSLNYKTSLFFCLMALCISFLKSSGLYMPTEFMFTIYTPSQSLSFILSVPYLFYELQSQIFSFTTKPIFILSSYFRYFCLRAGKSLLTKQVAKGNQFLFPSNSFSLPEKEAPMSRTVRFIPARKLSSELMRERSLICQFYRLVGSILPRGTIYQMTEW